MRVWLYIYFLHERKKKSAYEQWNVSFIFQEMPGLALPVQPYYTSQYTNIMINTSYIITYLLHISLPPVILKNNTQDVKKYCVVSNGTVCSSCLSHFSEGKKNKDGLKFREVNVWLVN